MGRAQDATFLPTTEEPDKVKGQLGWWPAQHTGPGIFRAVEEEQRASGAASLPSGGCSPRQGAYQIISLPVEF
jgi:hypothetical protein